jgi:hypothetical protein
VWLTVSDIIPVTQATSAAPPSWPPPFVPMQPPTESVTIIKTYHDHHNQVYHHHSVGFVDTLKSSQINDLEDFFHGKAC